MSGARCGLCGKPIGEHVEPLGCPPDCAPASDERGRFEALDYDVAWIRIRRLIDGAVGIIGWAQENASNGAIQAEASVWLTKMDHVIAHFEQARAAVVLGREAMERAYFETTGHFDKFASEWLDRFIAALARGRR